MAGVKGKSGRKAKAPTDKPLSVHTTLDPVLHAAWKADGRPLNAIIASVLMPSE